MQSQLHPTRCPLKFLLILIMTLMVIGGVFGAQTLNIISPNGGEVLSGTHTVSWDYSDSINSQTQTCSLYNSIAPGVLENTITTFDCFENCNTSSDFSIITARSVAGLPTSGAPEYLKPVLFSANDKLNLIVVHTGDSVLKGYTFNVDTNSWDVNNGILPYDYLTRYPNLALLDGMDTIVMDSQLKLFVFYSTTLVQSWDWNGFGWGLEPSGDANGLQNGMHAYAPNLFFNGSNYWLFDSNLGFASTNWESWLYSSGSNSWQRNDYFGDSSFGDVTQNGIAHIYNFENEIYGLTQKTNSGIGDFNGKIFNNGVWEHFPDISSVIKPFLSVSNASYLSSVDYNNSLYIITLSQTSTTPNWHLFRVLEDSYTTITVDGCSYPWDTTSIPDGSWFLDITVDNGTDFIQDSSNNSFFVKNYSFDVNKKIQKIGIYVLSNKQFLGSVTSTEFNDAYKYGGTLHEQRAFAACFNNDCSLGSYPGRIMIDNKLTTTCNYTWNCQIDLNIGSHEYKIYSATGGYEYSGIFYVDANTNLVRIYTPLSYNIFELFEDDTEVALDNCSNIWSITNGGIGNVQNKRISTGLYIGGQIQYRNDSIVIPNNCYSELNIPNLLPFALPAYFDGTEPLVIEYFSGDTSTIPTIYNTTISGIRRKTGEINFYTLYDETSTGKVEQRYASSDVREGFYSPLTTISAPRMNYDAALYGDVNLNTGDFGVGDNISCEFSLSTHGMIAYDANILLLTDKNSIYAQYSFSPSKKYSYNMGEAQENGAFNIIWHVFSDVNTVTAKTLQCALQTTNELGYKSGWIISYPRKMHTSNYSGGNGITINVKDEGGEIAEYSRYVSPQNGDLNYVDIYNFKYQPYFWSNNTVNNPFSLFEGETIVQTKDMNSNTISGKTFTINRGDVAVIDIYLPTTASSDNNPVPSNTRLIDDGITRLKCKADFYDKDLDWNAATFKIWSSVSGSYENPVCSYIQKGALTNNCMPEQSPCLVFSASTFINNECASDNDCYVEKYFGKNDCVQATGTGRITMYCAIDFSDLNGNIATAQASSTIAAQNYYIFAFCDIYTIVGGNIKQTLYSKQDIATAECEIGIETMLEPDKNFSVEILGKTLIYSETKISDSYGQKTYIFKADVTEELFEYATSHSSDGAVWEGDLTAIISHVTYGSYNTSAHASVILTGKREGDGVDVYTAEDFDMLYDLVTGFALGMMSDPITTIQNNFFLFILIIFGIIIFAPLALAASFYAKKRSEQ